MLSENIQQNFKNSLENYKNASTLTKNAHTQKLLAQVERLTESDEGIAYLFAHIEQMGDAGIFHQTAWENPKKLIPSLVKGTLVSGVPNSTLEVLSELRLLSFVKNKNSTRKYPLSKEEAQAVLEEILVHNLEFAFRDLSEQTRNQMSRSEQHKAFRLFDFLLKNLSLEGLKNRIAEEIRLICAQRPIITRKARAMIKLVYEQFELSPKRKTDRDLLYYVSALYAPTKLADRYPDRAVYKEKLAKQSKKTLLREAETLAEYMQETGLVSAYQAALLLFCLEQDKLDIVPAVLGLDAHGKAEWEKHPEVPTRLIRKAVSLHHYQSIYGLTRMLQRGLFSRRSVRMGLQNLMLVRLHPQIEKMILKSSRRKGEGAPTEALQYLLGATMRVLGQPLGIGQGNNATCQSARGISMWSQHAPAKLVDIITTVATQNNLRYRFEEQTLESIKLAKGLVDKLDFNLDAVSIILVPHLDKIYNEMMRLAFGRGEDPHKWVNPALYGHWIQVGFATAYDALSQTIRDFKGFARIFYAAFHPDYNEGRKIVYPNPVGIFITSSNGDMLGFHAVSLLRVKKDNKGEIRAYFLNPNNEGRQDWGQGIRPTVHGHGERHGESSLPFDQFLARLYAFHYNHLDVQERLQRVPDEVLRPAEALARESWGKSYTWVDLAKQW